MHSSSLGSRSQGMESFELLCSLSGCYFSSAGDNEREGPEASVTQDVRPSAGDRAQQQQQKKAKRAIRLSLAERAPWESRISEREGPGAALRAPGRAGLGWFKPG